MKSFSTYGGHGGAKAFADEVAKELDRNSPFSILQARDAITIRELLDGSQSDTGRPPEAVTSVITAARLLPAPAFLVEAAWELARKLDSVRPKLISKAVLNSSKLVKGRPSPANRRGTGPVCAFDVACRPQSRHASTQQLAHFFCKEFLPEHHRLEALSILQFRATGSEIIEDPTDRDSASLGGASPVSPTSSRSRSHSGPAPDF